MDTVVQPMGAHPAPDADGGTVAGSFTGISTAKTVLQFRQRIFLPAIRSSAAYSFLHEGQRI